MRKLILRGLAFMLAAVLMLCPLAVLADEELTPMQKTLNPMWNKDGIGFAYLHVEKGAVTEALQQGKDTLELYEASSLFVYLAAAQLMEEGTLSSELDVSTLLPEQTFTKRMDDSPITVMDLLNATAGWESHWREAEDVTDLLEYIRITEPSQVYPVGAVRTDGRYPTLVLAAAIEAATGVDFDAYVQSEIFAPLGMEHTTYVKDSGSWAFDGVQSSFSDLQKLLVELTGEGTTLFAGAETLDRFYSRSYGVHELMPGIAHGLTEFAGAEPCVGVDTREEAELGGLRIFPESRRAVLLVTDEVKGTDYARLPGSVLDVACGERTLPEKKTDLPKTAGLAGEYIQADRPQKGYLELARDMVGLQIIKAKPYTEHSVTTLYVFSTYYSSQYLNTFRGFTNLYFNTVDQIDDRLFCDIYGNLLYFVTNDAGDVEKFVFEHEEYVPTPSNRTIVWVNLTIWVIYLCVGYLVLNFILQLIMLIRDRVTYWPVFATSWLAFLQSCLALGLVINTVMLLYYSYAHLPFAICRLHLILNWVFTVGGLVTSALMYFFWNKGELRRHEKLLYTASVIAMILFICVCLWWNLYL